MTTFPGSPRLIKGALIGIDPLNPLASAIVFQYNPETMTRRLEARAMGGDDGDRSEVYRLSGPPKETISLNVEIDAADQLEEANPQVLLTGIGPALAALEMLLYPKSATVIANAALEQLGNLEIIPPEAPMTVFVWGAQRVLPVRLSGFSITEEAYDPKLNPIRAKVELSLQVMSYADFKVTHPGYSLFMVHQITKEALASTQIAAGSEYITAALKLS
jgi:hypothetical protein